MKSTSVKKSVSSDTTLIDTLKSRFEKNMHRHKGMLWSKVLARIEKNKYAFDALGLMEDTGGEVDVISSDKKSDAIIFCDCSPESPAGRRSLCYDREALNSRKEHKPKNCAVDTARAMGIELLDEEWYRVLQTTGPFDTKTSSWLMTPSEVRKLGGALFGDFRYGRVFIYHNGAESYYAARGFRGMLKI
ncbi:MAG TPA: DUF4256 domain-containing protein [Turneriella sp.]|nr:DUF4256 domain-containing protein [Turneriella sp.]